MRKTSIVIIAFSFVLSLCGCGKSSGKPENTSDGMYEIGLSALETTNDYLENTIDLDSAKNLMDASLRASEAQIKSDEDEVGDTLYGTEYSNDSFISNKIVLINYELFAKQSGRGTDKKIAEYRDELAELLNE